ncbi:MAG: tripartite tricarboxylate transporter substrate binding protein [Betaproteobacteria bacterium]|nr:tripartite tricarboxylate transporter substrate binding protein [Betaproteobacteria bacterium]
MSRTTRIALHCLVVCLVMFPALDTVAQTYPARPIRIIVPVPAGGPLDLSARLLAAGMSARMKQPVIVDNRPGGGSLIGAQAVARAEPDGYTILLGSPSIASYAAFMKDPKIDVLADFAFISMVVRIPYIVAVSGERPFRSMAELVTYSRANPGKLNYATFGNASRVATEIFNEAAGLSGNNIPYTGSAPAGQALARGDVDYVLDAMVTLQPLVNAGKARLLALTTSARVPALPDVPTLAEAGLAVPEMFVWYGLVAPAGTPRIAIERLNAEVRAFAASPEVDEKFRPIAFSAIHSTPEALRDLVQREQKTYLDAVRRYGIVPQ